MRPAARRSLRTQPEGAVREGLIIGSVERMRLNANGNPRFRVTFTDGTAHVTEPDASVNYAVENFASDQLPRRREPIRVSFNKDGRIIDMLYLDGTEA